ncbi:MAG: putative lipid II flippase FtsW [Acidimicrobiales bacterium]|nr:putative lipid II flippase FtsW [Acidimicrobiales bacterium]
MSTRLETRPPATRRARKKPAAKKAVAKKRVAKKRAPKKRVAKKQAVGRSAAKRAPKKRVAKATVARTTTTKKPSARKATARKPPARKATARNAQRGQTPDRINRGQTRQSVRPKRRASARPPSPSMADWLRRAGSWRPQRTPKLPATAVGERLGWSITILVIGLTLFGLVMVLSATSVSSVHQFDKSPFYTFSRQLRYAVIGAAAFIAGSRFNYRRIKPLAIPAGILSAVLLVAVLIPGVGSSANGSSRWLALGPVVIQPAELAKLSLILMVARILGSRETQMHLPERTIRPVIALVVMYSALLILQPKLGTPIIMGTVAVLMLFVAKAHTPHLLGWSLAGLFGATALAYSAPYRRARVFAFLDPWATADGIGLQTVQSQIGIASGGLFGRGLGGSRAKWGFLPEAQTDFIFAVVAEELGAIGALGLVLAFGLLGYLGFTAALRAPDAFGRNLAAGLTIWIVTQATLNIGMALGLMPITGEPLPFVSAGGSSLVTTLFASGLLVGVARRGRA